MFRLIMVKVRDAGLGKFVDLTIIACLIMVTVLIPGLACAGEGNPEYEKGFSEGYVLAIVQLNEDVIMNSYGMLELLLSKTSDCKILESQLVLWGINTPLADIAKQVAMFGKRKWPRPFVEHARITSMYLRKFMTNLARARLKLGWRQEDPAIEARIQTILGTYKRYGNPFGITVSN